MIISAPKTDRGLPKCLIERLWPFPKVSISTHFFAEDTTDILTLTEGQVFSTKAQGQLIKRNIRCAQTRNVDMMMHQEHVVVSWIMLTTRLMHPYATTGCFGGMGEVLELVRRNKSIIERTERP